MKRRGARNKDDVSTRDLSRRRTNVEVRTGQYARKVSQCRSHDDFLLNANKNDLADDIASIVPWEFRNNVDKIDVQGR